jgi:cell division protein FtsL
LAVSGAAIGIALVAAMLFCALTAVPARHTSRAPGASVRTMLALIFLFNGVIFPTD